MWLAKEGKCLSERSHRGRRKSSQMPIRLGTGLVTYSQSEGCSRAGEGLAHNLSRGGCPIACSLVVCEGFRGAKWPTYWEFGERSVADGTENRQCSPLATF